MADPTAPGALLAEHARLGLAADCERCFALCCVALAFSADAGFPIDKGAGEPCPNLADDLRCRVHDRLRPLGFGGCTTYDCFGAGQHVSQVTFGGRGWQGSADPERSAALFAALPVVRQLHELLWYLADARSRLAAAPIEPDLAAAQAEVEALSALPAADLLALDVAAVRAGINPLLIDASARVRVEADGPRRGRDRRGADLLGARLRGADLRGVDLRGACLIAADLRDADLRRADLIGADLRDADLRGARLDTALFVAQAQVNAAVGDVRTTLAATLVRPAHWAPTRVALRQGRRPPTAG